MTTDRYQEETARQNSGGVCTGCGQHSGHIFICPCVNPTYAEVMEKRVTSAHEFDAAFLKGVGIERF